MKAIGLILAIQSGHMLDINSHLFTI